MTETDIYLGTEVLGLADRPCGLHIPTSVSTFGVFRAAIKKYVKPGRRDVFLDYGSGSGRALLMAATFPFRKIIGVEFSEQLNAKAAAAIEPLRGKLNCQDIQLITGDATQYDPPDDVTVIYFYNSFWGDVMAQVLEKVRRSLVASPRRLTIVFNNPVHFTEDAAACGWLVKCGELQYQDTYQQPPIHIYESALQPSP